MLETVTATFEDGVFKPDAPVSTSPGARVRLTIDDKPSVRDEIERRWNSPERKAGIEEFQRMVKNTPAKPGGTILTREQLHDSVESDLHVD